MQAILGHDHAIGVLQAVLRSGRVHHAWVFQGPAGVGKFTTAVEFARLLLDPAAAPDLTGRITADPESRVCQLIDAGTHPDLHIIRKELALYSEDKQVRDRKLMNIPLEVVRKWMIGGADDSHGQAPAYRSAAMGHGKVFIIDEAELLDQHTQNALLKTLEEPPRETYIILITSRPDRLLPTIRSRCQIVRFGPLDDESMRAWFAQADFDVDATQRAWIEHFAAGSPGVAQLAAEYGFHQWHQQIAPMLGELDAGRFPAEMGESLAGLIDEFAKAWVKRNTNASKDKANKDGTRYMLAILAAHARRWLAKSCDDEPGAERWMAVIDLLREAERQMYANVNLKMLLENLVVQWAALPRRVPAGA